MGLGGGGGCPLWGFENFDKKKMCTGCGILADFTSNQTGPVILCLLWEFENFGLQKKCVQVVGYLQTLLQIRLVLWFCGYVLGAQISRM